MDGLSESAAQAARELRILFSRLRRRMREVATDDELTPSQTAVLARLRKDGPSSTSALASTERVRPQSMAAILAVLERQGLIKRAPDPDDGRRQVISLTATGRHRAENQRQIRGEWLARAMQDQYSDRERRIILEALALLERLTES